MADVARAFLESVLDDAQSAQAAGNEAEYHKLCDFVADMILHGSVRNLSAMLPEYARRFGQTRTYSDGLLLALAQDIGLPEGAAP